jgi:ABC-type multidrug transport system ATPase subunit
MNLRIDVQNLGKRFQTEWLFRHFTFSFQQGNIYAVTGPNGSGKSTLLQVLTGHILPTEGKVQFAIDNHIVETDEMYRLISVAAPYLELIDEFTLREHLHFHFRLKPLKKGYSISQVIDEMYLTGASDMMIGNFSSGMKQRLKLGLCFFARTPVIFLDEPSTNLDESAFTWYRHMLHQHSRDSLVIIASNNPAEYPENSLIIDIPALKPRKKQVTSGKTD